MNTGTRIPPLVRQLRQDHGSATVEGALALSTLVLIFAMILAGVATVLDQLRCIDAAGEAARLLSRGQEERAEEAVRRLAPAEAELEIIPDGRAVTVTVQAQPAGGFLPGVRVHSQAHAELEPGVRPDTGHVDG